MTITDDQIRQIQKIEVDIGEMIRQINPTLKREWQAFEKLVAAHKALRDIDTDALLQIGLPYMWR
jgi:hypothetical protein